MEVWDCLGSCFSTLRKVIAKSAQAKGTSSSVAKTEMEFATSRFEFETSGFARKAGLTSLMGSAPCAVCYVATTPNPRLRKCISKNLDERPNHAHHRQNSIFHPFPTPTPGSLTTAQFAFPFSP